MSRENKKAKSKVSDDDQAMSVDKQEEDLTPMNSQSDCPEALWGKQPLFKMGWPPSPERTRVDSSGQQGIPLGKETPGSSGIGFALQEHLGRLSAVVPTPNSSPAKAVPPQPARGEYPPAYWDLKSREGVRISTSFLESHIRDLIWMRECILDHHKSLVRNQNITLNFRDAVARAMYLEARKNQLSDHLEGLSGADTEALEEGSADV